MVPLTRRGMRAGAALATLALLAGVTPSADGFVQIIGFRPLAQLILVVGPAGPVVDLVRMDVPAGDVGNQARPVTAPRPVQFVLIARAPFAAPPPRFALSADSSAPLTSAAGATIPMSEIEWTSAEGSVPSGRFDGTADQLVLSDVANRLITDRLTFTYRNSRVVPGGDYRSRVRFTVSVP